MIGIIIPTKNRSEFMIRQLYYYASVQCPHTIYIGDSSDEQNAKKIQDVIHKLKDHLKIVYQPCPGLGAPVTEKILINMVEEKYSAFVGDDDFLVPKSLGQCASFLDTNPDYSTAQGEAIVFILRSNGVYGEFDKTASYRLGQQEENSTSDRLKKFFNRYWVPAFSVHRTEEFASCLEHLDSVPDDAFTELLTNGMSIIQGKSKKLNVLFLIRQVHDQRMGLPRSLDWITNPNWQPSFQVFHNALVEGLIDKKEISSENASEVVNDAFLNYFVNHLSKAKKSKSNVSKLQRKSREIKQLLTQQFPTLNSVYQRLRHPGGVSLSQLLTPSSRFYKDFIPIYNLITTQSNLVVDPDIDA